MLSFPGNNDTEKRKKNTCHENPSFFVLFCRFFDLKYITVICFLCLQVSWFWHCTVHNLVDLYPSPNMYDFYHWLYSDRLMQSRRQSSHPLCHVLLDQSWLYGCNIQSLACAHIVHLRFVLSLFCLCFVISQGRVSSVVSSPWKAVLSSSCLPGLEGPGGPAGRGGPSKGWGVSWCPAGGGGQWGTGLARVWRRCRLCLWFLWWPGKRGGGEEVWRHGAAYYNRTKTFIQKTSAIQGGLALLECVKKLCYQSVYCSCF